MNELLKLLGSGNKNVLQVMYNVHSFNFITTVISRKFLSSEHVFVFECNTQQTRFRSKGMQKLRKNKSNSESPKIIFSCMIFPCPTTRPPRCRKSINRG